MQSKKIIFALLLTASIALPSGMARAETVNTADQTGGEAERPVSTTINQSMNPNRVESGPKKESNAPPTHGSITTPAWLLVPHASIEGVYTDNANDVPGGGQNDFVVIAGLGGRLTVDTPRLQMTSNYQGSYAKYLDNSQQDHFSNQLIAGGQATLVPNFVFLDFHALADVLRRDIGGTTGPTALNDTNSVQTYVLTGSPYARYEISHAGNLELRYSSNFTWFTGHTGAVGSTIAPIGNSNQQAAKIEFSMPGTLEPRLMSSVFVSGQYTYAPITIGTFRRNQAESINEYQLSRSFSLVGATGYEEFHDRLFPNANGEGVTWSGGFRWRPNGSSSILLTYGRYDLKTDFAGEVQFRLTPLMTWYAAYTNSITSSQQQLANGTGASSFIQNGNLNSETVRDSPIAGVTFDENPVVATLNREFIKQQNEMNGVSDNGDDMGDLNTPSGVPVLSLNSYFPIQNNLYRDKSLRTIIYHLSGNDTTSLELYHNDRTSLTFPILLPQRAIGGKLLYATNLSLNLKLFGVLGFQRLDAHRLFGGNITKVAQAALGVHYDLGVDSVLFARYDFNRSDVKGPGGVSTQNSVSVGIAKSF